MSEERKLLYRFAVSLGIFFTVILLNGFILTIKVDGLPEGIIKNLVGGLVLVLMIISLATPIITPVCVIVGNKIMNRYMETKPVTRGWIMFGAALTNMFIYLGIFTLVFIGKDGIYYIMESIWFYAFLYSITSVITTPILLLFWK
ncbi:MAG: hypothetical protein IKL22_03280 [Lachnospiraceae bacterium]|nr:hypothetical protein [Lachnospiraceae bacterium]